MQRLRRVRAFRMAASAAVAAVHAYAAAQLAAIGAALDRRLEVIAGSLTHWRLPCRKSIGAAVSYSWQQFHSA